MTVRRRWTEETTENELAAPVAELGRMPTRGELSDRALAGAWAAIQRLGGLPAWRDQLLTQATEAPSRRDIEERAYFIFEQCGGDPLANWLTAERQLAAPSRGPGRPR